MLSRSAQGLYWMGRYLERAQHGCRLLTDQMEAIEDQPVDQVDRRWRRIYTGLGRAPLAGGLESSRGDDVFMLVDAFTLADDLTFEPNNPDAIRSCLAAARENARQVRNLIGKDMWSRLNVAYLELREAGITEIWKDRPAEFYVRSEDAVRAFLGIADSTMYRDAGWHFLELGRFVERAQALASLLDAQLAVFPSAEPNVESAWHSLLRICEARMAYRRLHSVEYQPHTVVDFIVADTRLSRSIRHALGRVSESLEAISGGEPLAPEASRRVGRMAARIDDGWPRRDPDDDSSARSVLQEIRQSLWDLDADITSAYFDYDVRDRLPEAG